MKTIRGFTLIELIVVLAILGILAAWGVPNFHQMVANNRLVTNANNLVYTFQLARSEAITRARPVDIVADGTWQGGWRVEVPALDTTILCGEDAAAVLIKNWEGMVGTAAITGGATCYRIDAQGRLETTGTLKLCDNRVGEIGRVVNLNKIGRVYISDEACN